MMQVIKIGQTKFFVIMQGCIFNLTVSHPFLPFRTPAHNSKGEGGRE